METALRHFLGDWQDLKNDDAIAFLQETLRTVASTNVDRAKLSPLLQLVSTAYREIALSLVDAPLQMNNRVAVQWQIACRRPSADTGLTLPPELVIGGADFLRVFRHRIQEMSVYLDQQQLPQFERLAERLLQPEKARAGLGPTAGLYEKSSLTTAASEQIRQQISHAFETDKLYLQSDLNLSLLAHRLGLKTNYISQVLSQQFNANFYQLVNRYRINEAKRLLMQQPTLSVLEIACSVGFNSKSVFYSAFRDATGVSPGEFRKTMLARQH